MRRWSGGLIFAISAAATLMIALRPASGQPSQAYRAPRLPGTENPDLNGIWEALNTANWDLEPHASGPSPFPAILGAIAAEPAGQGVVEGGTIPYQPWALAKRKENFQQRLARPKDRESNEATGDPEAKCYMPGVPRATYMPFPKKGQTPENLTAKVPSVLACASHAHPKCGGAWHQASAGYLAVLHK